MPLELPPTVRILGEGVVLEDTDARRTERLGGDAGEHGIGDEAPERVVLTPHVEQERDVATGLLRDAALAVGPCGVVEEVALEAVVGAAGGDRTAQVVDGRVVDDAAEPQEPLFVEAEQLVG